jgi:hypothetical protein
MTRSNAKLMGGSHVKFAAVYVHRLTYIKSGVHIVSISRTAEATRSTASHSKRGLHDACSHAWQRYNASAATEKDDTAPA